MEWSIWIAAAACLLGCYFAACHIALKSFSRKRLADVLEEKHHTHRLAPFLEQLPKHLLLTATIRTCLSLAVLLATLYVVETQIDLPGKVLRYLVAFGIAGVLLSIFVVAIPVSWARYRRESLVAWSMPLLRVMVVVLGPVATLLHLFDPIIRRISGADLEPTNGNELSDEVLTVVEDHQSGQAVDEVQKEMLEAVFDLPSTAAAEIMTPRTEVRGIEIHATLAQVKEEILRVGHSRIPVYEESLDHIVGILYVKDLIAFIPDDDPPPGFDLRQILREPFMVPESKSVRELLAEFKGRKVHMAIVLDEYGGTAGLISIEDILEEIVGEIQDEYEVVEEEPQVARLDDATIEVDARMHIDDLNDTLDVELPEDEDYDTVGGFVISTLGHIPEADETFDFEQLRFTVTQAQRTRVLRVKVEQLESVGSPMAAAANGK